MRVAVKRACASNRNLTYSGRKAARIASSTAGSMLATRTVLPHTRLTPMQKIRTEPTNDRFAKAAAVINGFKRLASSVTAPCRIATGMASSCQEAFKTEAKEIYY